MREVIITKEPVELFKILKFEGLAENGGEAKAAIEQGLVKVNNAVETRKRKQIVSGDLIEFAGETLRIVLQQSEGKTRVPTAAAPAQKKRRAGFPRA